MCLKIPEFRAVSNIECEAPRYAGHLQEMWPNSQEAYSKDFLSPWTMVYAQLSTILLYLSSLPSKGPCHEEELSFLRSLAHYMEDTQ